MKYWNYKQQKYDNMKGLIMGITTIFFDLDGTLLPMDNDVFTKGYFKLLVQKLSPYGYDPQELVSAIWKGTEAMVKNDGSQTNYDAFWKTYAAIFGNSAYDNIKLFDDFYSNEFDKAKEFCGYEPQIEEIVHVCRNKGYRLVVAANPIFPMTAQKARISWAGISADCFEYISSYENSHFCKPDTRYFSEIMDAMNISPENCLIIGNDVNEDMIARSLGAFVFLLTNYIINHDGKDISVYPNGNYDDLKKFLESNI